MIVVYIVGGILIWVIVAFGVAVLNRGTASREDAHLVAWITAFWPVTLPAIAVCAIILCVICGGAWMVEESAKGVVKVGAKYIDFIQRKT
jgi:hypothetical protein